MEALRKTTLTSLKSLLQAAAKSLGVERAAYTALIAQMWLEVVGAEAARESRVVGMRGGVVLVETSSGLWVQELSARRATVMDQINQRLGAGVVQEIRVRQGEGPFGGVPHPVEKAVAEGPGLTPGELAGIEQVLTEITDPGLREAARRAMVAQRQWRNRQAGGQR